MRREKYSKIKATITKRWSEFCWAAVWLQPAAGEEVQRKDFCVFWTQCLLPGAISDERFRCLVHPEPRPRATSSHRAGFRKHQGLGTRRQREEGREKDVVAVGGNSQESGQPC